MKQQIKNLILIAFIASLIGIGFSQNFLPISTLSAPYTCGQKSKLYLGEDSDKNGLGDYRLYLRNNFRLFSDNPPSYNAGQIYQYDDPSNANNTKIFYYAAELNILKKRDVTQSGFFPLDNLTFKRASWVFPYNQRVRGIDTNNTRILFSQPSSTGVSNIVSFIYSYKYAYALGYLGGTSPYWYNFVSSGMDFHGLTPADYVQRSSNRKREWSTIQTLDNCKNYELYRCGDGEVQTYDSSRLNQFTGELCDDGTNNGQPGYCDIYCGRGGAVGYCGDGILQEELDEVCDDGLDNTDDPQMGPCSTFCIPNPGPESFPEIFG